MSDPRPLRLNTVFSLIERVTRPSLANALSYVNADRDKSGGERYSIWLRNLDVLSWNIPFSRHVDGYDHTHFVLDIDIRLTDEDEERYSKYQDKLRLFKLGAGVEYFRGWKSTNKEHKFAWKIGGSGLHAIQRIDKKVSRKKLKDLVCDRLFPPCSRIDTPDLDRIKIKEYKNKNYHRCDETCDGWGFRYVENKKSGFCEREKLDWSKNYRYKNTVVTFKIDLRLFLWDKINIRWFYSPVLKIPQRIYFSIPLKKWDMKWVEKYSSFLHVEEIVTRFSIPKFSFGDFVDLVELDEAEWKAARIPKGQGVSGYTGRTSYPDLKLYEVEEERSIPFALNQIMDRMTNEFTSHQCSPCIKQHYDLALGTRGAHWNRFPPIRYLAHQGYNIHQIANWIRFRLNDQHDNLPHNRHKMKTFLYPVVGDLKNPNQVPSCARMQSDDSQYKICTEEMQAFCGRVHPLSSKKLVRAVPMSVDISSTGRPNIVDVSPTALVTGAPLTQQDQGEHWGAILDKINKVFATQDNLVIWKSTRAGVTTTMIYGAKQREKKMLCLVPTNKIALDTFQSAINIIREKTGQLVNGAVFTSNIKSCLILKFVEKDLRAKKRQDPEWGKGGLAWKSMMFHTKPECKGCRFKNATGKVPITHPRTRDIIPLSSSNVQDYKARQGWCAYQTFKRHIKNFDVVFMTYSKLNSLRSAPTKENQEILQVLMDEFEILFLDEINTVAQGSSLNLKVFIHYEPITTLDQLIRYDLLSILAEEMEQLSNFSSSEEAGEIKEIIDKFILKFKGLRLRDWLFHNMVDNSSYDIICDNPTDPILRHPLTYPERERLKERFGKYHIVLENYAKTTNLSLCSTEKVLVLLGNPEFVGYNLPQFDNPFLEYTFVVSPNIREVRGFVRDFTRAKPNNRVICTDANLPEANISDLLGVQFTDFVVGDPRKTNEHQLILADYNKIYPRSFLRGKECKFSNCWYWDTGREQCQLINTYQVQNEDGNKELVVESAHDTRNNLCFKEEFLFLKDVRHMIGGFGSEKIFLVFPNRQVYYWFRRNKHKVENSDDLKISYYRSDLTIGVECERRIMITLGSPIPPKNSHLWLAYFYHRMGLLNNFDLLSLADKLRLNSMRSAFWQTTGRAKDPLGIERSVVMCWGLGADGLIDAFQFGDIMTDSMPKYELIDSRKDLGYSSILYASNMWRRHGIIMDAAILKLTKYLSVQNRSGVWFSARQVQRDAKLMPDDLSRVYNRYKKADLLKFNLQIVSKPWGHRTTYRVRHIKFTE